MSAMKFPTIFSLACERLGARAANGSGIIKVANFGDAAVPSCIRLIADANGRLATALDLLKLCFAISARFGWHAQRSA